MVISRIRSNTVGAAQVNELQNEFRMSLKFSTRYFILHQAKAANSYMRLMSMIFVARNIFHSCL